MLNIFFKNNMNDFTVH